jgi:hypothetical protein
MPETKVFQYSRVLIYPRGKKQPYALHILRLGNSLVDIIADFKPDVDLADFLPYNVR